MGNCLKLTQWQENMALQSRSRNGNLAVYVAQKSNFSRPLSKKINEGIDHNFKDMEQVKLCAVLEIFFCWRTHCFRADKATARHTSIIDFMLRSQNTDKWHSISARGNKCAKLLVSFRLFRGTSWDGLKNKQHGCYMRISSRLCPCRFWVVIVINVLHESVYKNGWWAIIQALMILYGKKKCVVE